jgi:hypothetical protein
MEAQWGYRSVPANQEAYFFGHSQGANSDGAGPAPSEDEDDETGRTTPNPFTDSTGEGYHVTETRAEIPGVGTAVLFMPSPRT